MASVFISYRREDNPYAAGRIYDRLRDHFGEESVFFDIHTVPFGMDFRKHVDEVVSKCDILLVVIGDNWLSRDDQGKSRLENPEDFVRIEIETALERNIPIVPVPVSNAGIPRMGELPEAISDLSYRNAAEVRSGTAFKGHIERLIHGIESILAEKPEPEPESGQKIGITSRDRVIGTLAGAAFGTVLGVIPMLNLELSDWYYGLYTGLGGATVGAISGMRPTIIAAAAIGAGTGWVLHIFLLGELSGGSIAAGGVFGMPVGGIIGAFVGVILENMRKL